MDDEFETNSGEEADFEDANDGGSDDNGEEKKHGTAGMADVISKILNKKVKEDTKNIILSKYKEGKKRKQLESEEAHEKHESAKRKAELREKNHVIPDRSNAEKEVILRKIGTKGVVKLFNAVTKHQKETESKLKKASTIGKKDKILESVSQSSFLDMLKTDSASKDSSTQKKETTQKKKDTNDANDAKTPSWNILRDDFMLGSKMKDWDKEDEASADEDENEADEDSDDDGSE
eukprot:gene18183-19997_t